MRDTNHLAPSSKGELVPKVSYSSISRDVEISFLDLEFMSLLLNLIAFIISIETEASLLALAKAVCIKLKYCLRFCGRVSSLSKNVFVFVECLIIYLGHYEQILTKDFFHDGVFSCFSSLFLRHFRLKFRNKPET